MDELLDTKQILEQVISTPKHKMQRQPTIQTIRPSSNSNLNIDDETITLRPIFTFNHSGCKNQLERWMMYPFITDSLIQVIILVCSLVSVVYTVLFLDWIRTVLNLCFILGMVLIYRKTISNVNNREHSLSVNLRLEKIKVLVSMFMFTVRYYYIFHTNRILFLPTMFFYIVGGNRSYGSSMAWGLLPSYYYSVLFVGTTVWEAGTEWMEFGCSERWMAMLSEGVCMLMCLWGFTYYLGGYLKCFFVMVCKVTVTGFLQQKVETLEETSKKLEEALSGK